MWLPTAPCFLKGHAFKRFCGYPINYICCKRKKNLKFTMQTSMM